MISNLKPLLLRVRALRPLSRTALLEDALLGQGITDVLIVNRDFEDWRCALGEGTYKGARVRFVSSPREDGMFLVLTDQVGRKICEKTIAI
jgi:hypothetical protein